MKHNTSNILLKLMSLAMVLVLASCGKGKTPKDNEEKKKENDQKKSATTLEIVGSDISDPTKEFVVKIKNSGAEEVTLKDYKLEATIAEVDGKTDDQTLKTVSIKSGASTTLSDTFKVAASAEEEAAKAELDLKGGSATSVKVKFELKNDKDEVVATKTLTWTAGQQQQQQQLTASITKAEFSVDSKSNEETLKVFLKSGPTEFDIKTATVKATENGKPNDGIKNAVKLNIPANTKLKATEQGFEIATAVTAGTLKDNVDYNITVELTLKGSTTLVPVGPTKVNVKKK